MKGYNVDIDFRLRPMSIPKNSDHAFRQTFKGLEKCHVSNLVECVACVQFIKSEIQKVQRCFPERLFTVKEDGLLNSGFYELRCSVSGIPYFYVTITRILRPSVRFDNPLSKCPTPEIIEDND